MRDHRHHSSASRRDAIRAGLGAAIALAGLPNALPAFDDSTAGTRARPYLDAALRAERWIRKTRIETSNGVTWPAIGVDPTTVQDDLYSGSPGVVLFLLELHAATRDRTFLDEACAGADFLMFRRSARSSADPGFYSGLAGTAFTLSSVYDSSRNPKYRDAAAACVAAIRASARPAGAGLAWNDTTDIISGASGTGLYLLDASRSLEDAAALDVAVKAGRWLMERARREQTGRSWAMDSSFPRRMPNFSHGTAGVAYFLASLHAATGERAFLDAAIDGARYLESIARCEGDSCLVYHHDGGGEQLFYLGWCHGPAGTARLFHQLAAVTKDAEWSEWEGRASRGILSSGIPEVRTEGFWNNVGQCCGNAGVAEFFLERHRATGDPRELAFAKRMTADLLARATPDADGLEWIHAENRVSPSELTAQTGWMQGAAGIGALLLHLDGLDRGRLPSIVFPDSPYRRPTS